MSARPFFTIIVSGYQNEPFLPQCLASISGQTFGNFETICYVEESTDNSLAICQEWAKRDTRFIVATGPKSGSGSATRNYGIDHAKGKYLVIIDGDDWVATDMLEKLSNKLNETGPLDILAFAAEYASCNSTTANNTNRKNAITNFQDTDATPLDLFSGREAIRRIYQTGHSRLNAYPWLNLYRVEFLRDNHLRQLDGMVMEDVEWFPRVFFFAQKVAYLNAHLYYYRQHQSSVSYSSSLKCRFDMASHFHSLVVFLEMHSVPVDIQAICSNQWLGIFFECMGFFVEDTHRQDQKAILKSFFATAPRMPFWRFLLKAAWHRVWALPPLWLASRGCHLPAKIYFRKIYPALEWRFLHPKVRSPFSERNEEP